MSPALLNLLRSARTAFDMEHLGKRWTTNPDAAGWPEKAGPARVVMHREREFRCAGCGERKPESQIDKRYIVGLGWVYACKRTNCWDRWREANGK